MLRLDNAHDFSGDTGNTEDCPRCRVLLKWLQSLPRGVLPDGGVIGPRLVSLPEPEGPEWLTVSEVAAMTGFKECTVREWLVKGILVGKNVVRGEGMASGVCGVLR